MWILFARAPAPDAVVWPGRRVLAAIDALIWPAAIGMSVANAAVNVGLAGRLVMAICMVAGLVRLYRALTFNHRYFFTTWRWGRRIVWLLALGYALKLAFLL